MFGQTITDCLFKEEKEFKMFTRDGNMLPDSTPPIVVQQKTIFKEDGVYVTNQIGGYVVSETKIAELIPEALTAVRDEIDEYCTYSKAQLDVEMEKLRADKNKEEMHPA